VASESIHWPLMKLGTFVRVAVATVINLSH
jgi:hypothetical protein